MNNLFLRRKSKIYVKIGSGGATIQHVASAQKEAEQLGFVFSENLIRRLYTLSIDELSHFLRSLFKDLRELVGAHRTFNPLYPNFPSQVLALSESELYLNAIQHYLTLSRFSDDGEPRLPLLHGKVTRIIELGQLDEFESIFSVLAGARSSLSQQDKEDLEWFVRQYRGDIFRLLPGSITFKENIAHLGALLLDHVPSDATDAFLAKHFATATDVLRLSVALSGGDVSLAEPCKFKTMPRSRRKLLLALTECCPSIIEDMLRWKERWKRLGEKLHPGDHATRFPKTHAAFEIIRQNLPFHSFNAQVETCLNAGEIERAALTLKTRPGEFARRLDHLLRQANDANAIIRLFDTIADQVSSPVMLQVMSHFKHRGRHTLRVFFPKGNAAKIYAIDDTRTRISTETCEAIVQRCEKALIQHYSKLPPLGKCYISEQLTDYYVPTAQRSASRSLRTLTRGSRLPIPETAFARLFLWWMNGHSRTDLDLSAVLYNTNYQYIDALTYYNLRSYGAYHSGDVVDAPKGAAEFIDLDLAQLRNRGVRFVVMVVNSYTSQPYCDLPECFAGLMVRTNLDSGEAFEPRTVTDRVDLASSDRICLPLTLDLQSSEIIWLDIGLQETPYFNNIHNNLSGVSLMLRAMTSLEKPDLHTLFSLHAQARGEIVIHSDGADTIFDIQNGITPFDLDRIRAEFL